MYHSTVQLASHYASPVETHGLCRYFQVHGTNNVWQNEDYMVIQACLVQSAANSISGTETQQLFQLMGMFTIREL
jgi:hypothetical protein